ncbi:hypothetical protein ABZ215_25190 [Amycolatopsis sp. NPDC006131]|uniref:hypothetical protein n=1 Tax=Amycolatopsis sp. NPDC006131 TaxID=3156731 RepID=UPI0033BF25D6
MTWWATNEGSYVNSDEIAGLYPVQIGSNWWIRPENVNSKTLAAGPFTSAADATEAIRKLVCGVAPSTVV